MKKNKYVALFSSAAIASMIASVLSPAVYAVTDGIVVKGENGKNIKYSYKELENAAVNKALGDESKLFDSFDGKEVVAFHDDIRGYISYKAVENAAVNAALDDKEFNMDEFIKTTSEQNVIKDLKNVNNISEKDGKLVVTPEKESKELKVESVSAINKTGVTVKLAALEKDMAGATIQVKDPAGNMVAVVPQNLAKGATTATFPFTAVPGKIKAGNWTVEGQTFTILSSNAKLSGLTLDKGIWDKDFAKDKLAYDSTPANQVATTYNVYVGSDVDTVNVTPAADAGATLTAKITTAAGAQTVVLDNEKANAIKLGKAGAAVTQIEVTVIAPDKTTSKTYKVDVTRAAANKNNDAILSKIEVAYNSDPAAQIADFKKATTEYTTVVQNTKKTIKITPTQNVAGQKIFVNGKAVATGVASDAIDLAVGANVIEIKVIAEDNITVRTYNITVNRAAEAATNVKTLNSLTLSAGTVNGFTADSVANAANLTAKVANSVQDLTITPVATNANALVEVTAADNAGVKLEVVKNGASYTIKGLKEGVTTNVITIKVTPEDASAAQDYTLTVTRASATASDVAQLTAFTFDTDVAAVGVSNTALDGFKVLTTEYTKNVKNDQTNFGFTAPGTANSTVEAKVNGVSITANRGLYTGNLKIGENIITVKVTAENGIATKTYTLKVNRADVTASAVKTLNSLGLSAGELAGFTADSNAGAAGLTAKVANSVQDLTITPVATDAKAIVEVTAVNGGNKLEVVKNGASYTIKGLKEDANNVITIKVTPEDASAAETYTLTVTRVASNANDNAFLAGANGIKLAFNGGVADAIDGYKADTTSYTVNTAYTNNKVVITPTVADANAIITVNGKAVNSAAASNAIALAVGQNKVEVKVTAADGTTTKTYTVIINRAAETASDVSTLKGLTLSAGTLNGFKADDATANALSTSVLNSVKDLTITPALTDAKAKVVVTAKDAANKDLVVEAKDGAYTVKELSEGRNIITVKVTAEDGIASTTYTLAASRAAQGANIIAKLSGLVLDDDGNAGNEFKLSQAFASDKTDYKVYVANGQGNVFIKPTLDGTAGGATITIDGKAVTNDQYTAGLPIAIGDNNFAITITAADLTTTKTYNVDVVRASAAASKDATLSAITGVTPGKLNKTFNAETAAYTANVSHLVSTFTFKPVATDANARISVAAVNGGNALGTVKNADGSYTITGLLAGAGNVITVTNTAQDNTTTKAYTITVTKEAAPNQEQAAPTGLVGEALTAAGNDGKITGTTAEMQYKLKTAEDSAYKPCSATKTTGLAAGTYVVRRAAKAGFNAGATAEVTVPEYVAPAKDTDSALKTFTIGATDVSTLANVKGTGAEQTYGDFAGDKVKGIVVDANSTKAKSVVVKVNNTKVSSSDLATKVLAENDVVTVVVTAEDDSTTTYKVTVKKTV